ncbi:MAG TPA: hypothetical protein DCW68_00150 [Rhodospirillaceae bacterium]|nr:MAG: hypothetical protein A2018_01465 [Alphaproteobacteria bacterium GWF2_58_20]HAU28511.1 hypothetical protein [Rhodospirillaceae bacterium]
MWLSWPKRQQALSLSPKTETGMTGNFKSVPDQENSEDRIINWDDFKCFLAIRLDGFPGRPVIETIEPLYKVLLEKIESGEIKAYSRSGKMPQVGGQDMPLTDDDVELFEDGTYLRFGDIMTTFDALDEERKDIITQRLADRFYDEQAKRAPAEDGEGK